MLKTHKTLRVAFAIIAFAVIPGLAGATALDLPDGSKLDVSSACPVCSMKVETSSLGPAAVVFNDGKVVGFDTAGDLFRYLLDSGKYGFDPKSIKSIFVTEYGTKNFIDAKAAFFVVGSDLQGSMGPEVAAFSKKEDAETFQKEHKGKDVVNHAKITLEDLKSKKKMLKMQH
jgi:nitrous oxide reductase accessory protein NosL